ncbi:MAG: glycoside hydrolase family 9 protein [Ruminococcus sp.]|nr:glycoside hydrolase family 9 protein [Ruminococcus sp.]
MKFRKRFAAAALCAVTALTQTLSVMPTVNAAEELKDALANDSGLDIDFARALQYSIYFYDANMCGTEVDENNRYTWRGDCHTYDATCELIAGITDFKGTNLSQSFIDKYKDILDPDGDGCVDVAGGFHDAGDHVEFGMPENYSAAALGWGYYEFRDSYVKTGQDDHIETILRCFNDYLMKCTFLDDSGKVIAHCYQVGDGDNDHSFWNSPEVDEMPRPAFFLTEEKPQIDYTTSAAASLALNYLNFKDTDAEYAEKCLDYAKALWKFSTDALDKAGIKSQDDDLIAVLSDNADGPKGYYRSEKWVDDFCWAAGWLFLCTEDVSYLEAGAPFYDYYAPSGWCFCWNDVWSGAACVWARINQEYPDVDLINMLRTAQGKNQYVFENIWEQVQKCLPTWQGLETPQGYAFLNMWGSARYNTAMQLIGLVYDKYTNNGKPGEFSEWAKRQMEYLMGDNDITFEEAEKTGGPTHGSRSFIVGYNENSAKYPHHRAASGLTKCEDPDEHRYVLFGALAGGPGSADEHNDMTSDWIDNEVTIDYNAAFVGACAGLYAYYGTPDMQPTKDFPPKPSYSAAEGGGNNYWVDACGIDDLNADGCGVTKVSLMVRTDSTKAAKDISVRYYFDSSEISNVNSVKPSELYDQAAVEAAPADGVISGPYKYDKKDNTYYIEVKWDGYTIANSGKKYQFTVGMYYGDKWDPTNDPGYKDLKIYEVDDAFFGTGNEVRTDNICVYSGDKLVGGIEPDGSVPEISTQAPSEDTTTSTPATSSGGATSSARAANYGDSNCDEVVNLADAVLIMQYKANPSKYTITDQGAVNADVSGDGDGVTNKDALAIQMYLLGLITVLPE